MRGFGISILNVSAERPVGTHNTSNMKRLTFMLSIVSYHSYSNFIQIAIFQLKGVEISSVFKWQEFKVRKKIQGATSVKSV